MMIRPINRDRKGMGEKPGGSLEPREHPSP
jgi:hypothetical protein